jgi:multisubunit Na+/H+ antiporter MnhB subunit
MTFDIPHMIATAVIILAVVYGINHLPQAETMSKGRKALVTFVVLFVALLILNAFWPYGGGV